ncbi:MAG: universal stress protein [Firmicutes bacterium]|nr:universal stress protein [Bacillota bacterium]
MSEDQNGVSYRLIVAATDGSATALHAARHAISLARLSNARLRVIYVVNTHIAFHLGAYQYLALETLQEEGDRAVDEVVRLAEKAGLSDVGGAVLSGSPRQVIVDWAREQGADLIVVGSHGYSRLTYLLIGSVAEYVVRYAHCPVLVVREKKT